ncbi:aldose epimerase family protein [Secundilactobacillus malefermentans]|uniref:aldose epimerase family protein n=1 Tax=Secundilactobacillus malefermentans TaxID=176292 RepID=UPI0011C78AFA|nr:aldose epimerase family protein [Secundilactobacillus malefermentans]QEA31779.1 galactose mutarotase [Secundilactobacillus malefermentans]
MTNTSIKATVTPFDEYKGQQIFKLSLTNQHGVTVSALTLGATLYEILVPDNNGNHANLVLNYAHSGDYLDNPFYVCQALGRTGGRIGNGEMPLNGKTYTLPTNEGSTTLHGGPNGFNSQIWEGHINTVNDAPEICLTHRQLSSEDGYPGDMDAEIHYGLTEDDKVVITFTASSNKTTVFNPTIHTYFNLGTTDTIKDHTLAIKSDEHLDFDANKIPTGRLIPVADTPFDFRKATRLGDAIDGMMDTPEKGFDDIFKVNPDRNDLIAILSDPESGRSVEVESARNGLVVFTANSFTQEHMNFVRSNGVGIPYEGVALEAQNLPDATKHTGFGDITLPEGQKVTRQIRYGVKY